MKISTEGRKDLLQCGRKKPISRKVIIVKKVRMSESHSCDANIRRMDKAFAYS